MPATLDAAPAAASSTPPVFPAALRSPAPTLAREVADLRDPAWLTHPREQAQRLRERGRVHRDTMGLWLLLGHADCRAVMQSSHLSRDPRLSTVYPALRPFGAGSALEQAAERFMLFNDPPVHTRLRRAVAAAFTPAAIRQWRDAVTATTQRLLHALPADVPFDFMRGFAQVLPIRVICDLLGIDEGDFEQAKAWSDAAASVVEPVATRAARAEGAQAVAALTAFLREQVARRRARPGDSVLDRMIAAQRDDPRFDDDELLANLILLFIAGHETTTNLLGNGLLALLRHPPELARLRREPALMPQAIDEMLRYESPINMVARITREPWLIDDLTVPAGEVMYCMIGAANHDPAVFGDPDRFDIGRTPNPQLSFGGGVHYCVGAPLARLEAEVAFERVLRRFPTLELAGDADGAAFAEPRWRPMINLRGLHALWLRGAAAS
ncbi:MAG: cytochrome P450 [Rubrivivax sp.]|nr:cytochrome P450 [Rubrivivax sp.]